MKKVKAMALVLAVAMISGVLAGCSKTTTIGTDKFTKVCEKLKLEEFELDGDSPDMDDLEVDGAVAFQMTLADAGYAEDVMEAIEDLLDEADISTKSLSGKEFFSSKKEGYFRFHVDIAKLAKLVLENDDIEDYLGIYSKMKDIDIEDILSELKGDVAVTVEINGKNVFILLGGALNTKPTTLNSFAKSFGAACNPVSVPMNEKLIEEMIESAVDNYLSKLKSGAGF